MPAKPAAQRHTTKTIRRNDGKSEGTSMTLKVNRRRFLAGSAAVAGASSFPMPAIAQAAPIKVGVLTVKTGPLAAGGIHCEEGITAFLKDKNFTLAGRKVDLVVADSGGNPAGAKTKATELVERDKVNMIMGPFAAFEHLAIVDYLAQNKVPTFGYAGAEDVTQRKANPYIVRTSTSAAQFMYPLADFAVKELKLKNAISFCDDFAYGHEQVGGFQRVLEAGGGKIVKKLWTPLATPDYTPFLSQIADCDMVANGLTGANPLRFMKQYRDLGLKQVVLGGSTFADDTIMGRFGDEAIGMYSSIPYSLDIPTDDNKRFLASIRKHYGADVGIGLYNAAFYVNGMVLEEALKKTDGKLDDPDAFIKAVKSVKIENSPRGPVEFDEYGNMTFSCYIRRAEKEGGKIVNKIVKTYPKVSQFWTYDPKWFLQQPVYSRDYPPMKT
jgi:branched-chain amino acid transport system substrate-binding protein